MKAKKSVHEFFNAVLAGNTLIAKRGCKRRVATIAEDIDVKITPESHRVFIANVGDKLMLHGSSAEQIAIAEVRSVKLDGYKQTYFVSLGVGAVNDGHVQVMKIARAA